MLTLTSTFYTTTLTVALLVTVVLLVLPTPTITEANQAHAVIKEHTPTVTLLIKNADIFTGDGLVENQDIEIRDGVISNIASELNIDGASIVEAQGKTVVPGLIDAHTHSFANALKLSLNFGVSTHIDMFTPPNSLALEIEKRKSTSQATETDLFSSGMLATTAGGHGTQFGVTVDTLASPGQAEQWVDERVSAGADFIKLVYMPHSTHFKSIDRATASAIINAAHKKGLLVVAHISSQRAARELLEEDIDGFVHVFADEEVDDAFLELAKSSEIFVIPTLSVIASAANKPLGFALSQDAQIQKYLPPEQTQQLQSDYGKHAISGFNLATALHNTKRLHRAGITILAGSDAPNPGTTYGASLHQELELLVSAGLSPLESLQAATINVAKTFKLTDRGRIKLGQKADFLLLNSNPLQNIIATRDIASIYKNGHRVIRQNKEDSNALAPILSPILSDFSVGLNAPANLVWSKTDDSMAGGKSTVMIKLNNQRLLIDASVKPGFMFPWAGAGAFTDHPLSISNYRSLQFKVRGSQGQYQAMMFSATSVGAPPAQTIKVTDDWQTISLELKNFRGLDTSQFTGLAIVAGPTTGEFKYLLDDVKLVP